jgi:hypothetical protein
MRHVGCCVGISKTWATFAVVGAARWQAVLGATKGAPRDRAAMPRAVGRVTGKTVIQAALSARFRRFLTRVCGLANSC